MPKLRFPSGKVYKRTQTSTNNGSSTTGIGSNSNKNSPTSSLSKDKISSTRSSNPNNDPNRRRSGSSNNQSPPVKEKIELTNAKSKKLHNKQSPSSSSSNHSSTKDTNLSSKNTRSNPDIIHGKDRLKKAKDTSDEKPIENRKRKLEEINTPATMEPKRKVLQNSDVKKPTTKDSEKSPQSSASNKSSEKRLSADRSTKDSPSLIKTNSFVRKSNSTEKIEDISKYEGKSQLKHSSTVKDKEIINKTTKESTSSSLITTKASAKDKEIGNKITKELLPSTKTSNSAPVVDKDILIKTPKEPSTPPSSTIKTLNSLGDKEISIRSSKESVKILNSPVEKEITIKTETTSPPSSSAVKIINSSVINRNNSNVVKLSSQSIKEKVIKCENVSIAIPSTFKKELNASPPDNNVKKLLDAGIVMTKVIRPHTTDNLIARPIKIESDTDPLDILNFNVSMSSTPSTSKAAIENAKMQLSKMDARTTAQSKPKPKPLSETTITDEETTRPFKDFRIPCMFCEQTFRFAGWYSKHLRIIHWDIDTPNVNLHNVFGQKLNEIIAMPKEQQFVALQLLMDKTNKIISVTNDTKQCVSESMLFVRNITEKQQNYMLELRDLLQKKQQIYKNIDETIKRKQDALQKAQNDIQMLLNMCDRAQMLIKSTDTDNSAESSTNIIINKRPVKQKQTVKMTTKKNASVPVTIHNFVKPEDRKKAVYHVQAQQQMKKTPQKPQQQSIQFQATTKKPPSIQPKIPTNNRQNTIVNNDLLPPETIKIENDHVMEFEFIDQQNQAQEQPQQQNDEEIFELMDVIDIDDDEDESECNNLKKKIEADFGSELDSDEYYTTDGEEDFEDGEHVLLELVGNGSDKNKYVRVDRQQTPVKESIPIKNHNVQLQSNQ